MANIDPIATAGSFIRNMKSVARSAADLQADGVVPVRQLQDGVQAIVWRFARAQDALTALQEHYTNQQIAGRLGERLAVTPIDLIASYVVARDAVNALEVNYNAVVFPGLPREVSYDPATNTHQNNVVDVAGLTSLQANLTSVITAFAPFAD